MTREEHNEHWKVDRKPEDHVFCNLIGYGEFSQYDPKCPACWLGHSHTWEEHDSWLGEKNEEDEVNQNNAPARE